MEIPEIFPTNPIFVVMKNSEIIFGHLPDGREARLFTLKDEKGLEIRITNFGGIITNILVPDKYEKSGDVVLGYDTLDGYLENPACFGALIGRVAGRISKAKFKIDTQLYRLFKNDGENHLHGGKAGFNKKLWDVVSFDGKVLKLYYQSPDGEEGYPGNMEVEVIYNLQNTNELQIEYFAKTDRPTPVNLTNHSYFNLSGDDNVLDHHVQIQSDRFLEMDNQLIPTGKILPVENTALDFRKQKVLSAQLRNTLEGFDDYFVLSKKAGELSPAAVVEEPGSGRKLEVFTTQPGLVFYTANTMKNIKGKYGRIYENYAGFCFETQAYPDAINRPEFPSVILYPGDLFYAKTIYRFSLTEK